MVGAIAIYSFVALWVGYYLCVAVRGIARAGIVSYAKWIPARDLRVWISLFYLLLFIKLTMQASFFRPGTASWIKALLALPLIFFMEGVVPPQVLLLHTFDERNYPFGGALARAVTANVVSLFPGARQPGMFASSVARSGTGIGSKVVLDANWREMVNAYMRMSDVVVMDLSFARAGLVEEIKMLARQPSLLGKLVFVYRDSDSAQNGLSALRREFPELPELFPYGAAVSSMSVTPIDSWGPVGDAILARLSFQLPRWVVAAAALLVFLTILIGLVRWLVG